MLFKANCLLFNTDTNDFTKHTVTCVQDIIDIVSDGIKKNIVQIDIDKYHKVYYDTCVENMDKGVTGWVSLMEKHDESLDRWVSCKDKDYFFGNKILLVVCDDEKPTDIDDKEKDFIMSCISY